jgi:hypothetical protein
VQKSLVRVIGNDKNSRMTFSEKQIDEWVRLFGTLAAAALSGAAVGVARPDQISHNETFCMILSAVGLMGMIMYWRRTR